MVSVSGVVDVALVWGYDVVDVVGVVYVVSV